MKYLSYVLRNIGTVFYKLTGVFMFYLVFPFEKYLNNTVYNYHYENGIYCRGMTNYNTVTRVKDGWKIVSGRNGSIPVEDGFVRYRKIGKVEYVFALAFWFYLDNGSNHDTVDRKFTTQWAEEIPWLHKRDYEKMKDRQYGSAFELGDKREREFYLISSTRWLWRNTAYNYNYKMQEIDEGDPRHFYIRFEKLGWHFGYIPYTNSTKTGRMVWFSEDIDKIDKDI